MLFRPHYPASSLRRILRDEDQLQLDFMPAIHGIRSFESLRRRAGRVDFDGAILLVADLADVLASKRAAGRPRDRAVLEVLENALAEKRKVKTGRPKSPQSRK